MNAGQLEPKLRPPAVRSLKERIRATGKAAGNAFGSFDSAGLDTLTGFTLALKTRVCERATGDDERTDEMIRMISSEGLEAYVRRLRSEREGMR